MEGIHTSQARGGGGVYHSSKKKKQQRRVDHTEKTPSPKQEGSPYRLQKTVRLF